MARKTEQGGKFRNVQGRTWNMARKLNIMENDKHPLYDLKNDKSLNNMKNEKCTLSDLKYSKKKEIKEIEKYKLLDVKYGEENRKRWKI